MWAAWNQSGRTGNARDLELRRGDDRVQRSGRQRVLSGTISVRGFRRRQGEQWRLIRDRARKEMSVIYGTIKGLGTNRVIDCRRREFDGRSAALLTELHHGDATIFDLRVNAKPADMRAHQIVG